MLNETFTINGKTYKQVNRTKAKQYFNAGKEIYLHASNLNFYSDLFTPCPIDNKKDETFDHFCNEYKYYCCNNETGRYLHYFVELSK